MKLRSARPDPTASAAPSSKIIAAEAGFNQEITVRMSARLGCDRLQKGEVTDGGRFREQALPGKAPRPARRAPGCTDVVRKLC